MSIYTVIILSQPLLISKCLWAKPDHVLDGPPTKLPVAATAVRAYCKRHFATLIRCCEALELVGQCSKMLLSDAQTSMHALSHKFAGVTRDTTADHEDAVNVLVLGAPENRS